MNRCMDRWIDGWMDGWMDRWIVEGMEENINWWICERILGLYYLTPHSATIVFHKVSLHCSYRCVLI